MRFSLLKTFLFAAFMGVVLTAGGCAVYGGPTPGYYGYRNGYYEAPPAYSSFGFGYYGGYGDFDHEDHDYHHYHGGDHDYHGHYGGDHDSDHYHGHYGGDHGSFHGHGGHDHDGDHD